MLKHFMTLTTLTACLFTANVFAATTAKSSSLYFDAAFGNANVQFSSEDNAYPKKESSIDNFRFAIGYNFLQQPLQTLGVEIGDNRLGSTVFNFPTGTETLVFENEEFFRYTLSDVDLLFKYAYHLNSRFSLFGKVGLAYVTQGFALVGSYQDFRRQIQPEIALGGQWKMAPSWSLNLADYYVAGGVPTGIRVYDLIDNDGNLRHINNKTAAHNLIMLGLQYQLPNLPRTLKTGKGFADNLYFGAQLGAVSSKEERSDSIDGIANYALKRQADIVQRLSLAYLKPVGNEMKLGAELGLASYGNHALDVKFVGDNIRVSIANAKPITFDTLFDLNYQVTPTLQLIGKAGFSWIQYLDKKTTPSGYILAGTSVTPESHFAPQLDVGARYSVINSLAITVNYSTIFDQKPDVEATSTSTLKDGFMLGTLSTFWLGISYRL